MSCGAALFHARIALRHFGFRDDVELFPDPADRDFLARVRPGGPYDPSDEERALFDAIPRRHTYRFAFESRPIPQQVAAELQEAASEEGAWLRILEGERARSTVASLIMQGDRIQMADRKIRRELAAWTRPNSSRVTDGIPGSALGFGDLKASAAGGAHRDAALPPSAPALGLRQEHGRDAAAAARGRADRLTNHRAGERQKGTDHRSPCLLGAGRGYAGDPATAAMGVKTCVGKHSRSHSNAPVGKRSQLATASSPVAQSNPISTRATSPVVGQRTLAGNTARWSRADAGGATRASDSATDTVTATPARRIPSNSTVVSLMAPPSELPLQRSSERLRNA